MSATQLPNLPASLKTRRAVVPPPAWARAFADDVTPTVHASNGATLSISRGRDATLVTATYPNAPAGDAEAFHRSTAAAYRAVRRAVERSPHPHVVRMWNWIPDIHAAIDAAQDRYMAFNAARFEAMSAWFGGPEALAGRAPAASGVGHDGGGLVVQALAMAEPGAAFENPRQVPAYRYSRKYGPLPPCFARATRIAGPRDALLVAGTAAITGEQSYHLGDLHAQFALTLDNLRAVLSAGRARAPGIAVKEGNPGLPAGAIAEKASVSDPTRSDVLHTMRHVRVYIARDVDRADVERLARAAFASDRDLEFVPADLCRAELLVEIEGAAWDASASPPNQQ